MQEPSIRSIIIDDDKTIGDILKDLISKEHASVEVFNDSFEAIEFIKRNPFDIVITDLVMPKVDGLELLHQAKAINPEVVVIIITGHGSLESAIEAIRGGAYDYIKKPFKLQEMEIVFNNAVERVKLTRENTRLLKELENAYAQLVAVKEEREKGDYEREAEQERARLNFFASNRPGLHLVRSASTGEPNYFEQLQNVATLKKDGLLTEKEFKTLKAQIIKHLESSKTY